MAVVIAGFAVGVPLVIFIGFVLGTRKLGRAGIRQYQLGGDDSVNFQSSGSLTPRCACYVTSDKGISAPRQVRGRLCEAHYLNTGQWPEWCRGPKV